MYTTDIRNRVRSEALLVAQKFGTAAVERVSRCTVNDRTNWRTCAAGMAHTGGYTTRIDMNMLLCDNEAQYEKTLYHEYAHIVAPAGEGHGNLWKRIMRALKQEPVRCHNLDTHAKLGTGTLYHCNCKQWNFSQRRVNNIRRGRSYTCASCHTLVTVGPFVKAA